MNIQINSTNNIEKATTRYSYWLTLAFLLFMALGVRLALAPIMLNYDDRRDYVSAGHKAMRYGVGHYYDHAKKADREYKGISGVPLPYPPMQIYAYEIAAYLYQNLFNANFVNVQDWRDMPVNVVALYYLINMPMYSCDLVLTDVVLLWLQVLFVA